jgi:hypothetical protein
MTDPIKDYIARLTKIAIASAAVYGVRHEDTLEYVVGQVAAQVLEDSITTARHFGDVTVLDTTVRALRESAHE